MRILLKHPYARRPASAEMAYAASNLTLQEYLETSLPLPRARDVFGSQEFDRQYYEFYYHKLMELSAAPVGLPGFVGGQAGSEAGESMSASAGPPNADSTGAGPAGDETVSSLDAYADPSQSGRENTEDWGPDELRMDQINDRIRTAAETNSWGSIPGRWKKRILAVVSAAPQLPRSSASSGPAYCPSTGG